MATIEIRGVKHFYSLTPSPNPSSPVLVFVHGWLLSCHYWQPLVEQLSPVYQCLTYDLRGFGDSVISESKKPHSFASPSPRSHLDFSLAAYAQDLKILLQKLNVNNVWLLGHSLGGSIALWSAELCPQEVKGVICLNSGGGIYLKEEFKRFRTAGQQLVKRRPRWLVYLPFLDLAFARMMVARPLARCWGSQRVIDFVRADPQAALGALLHSTTEAEVHLLPQIVSRLKQPVYFIAGDRDRVMEPQYVRHLASFHFLFGDGGDNVFEIPHCGHLSMVEQPEAVGSLILQTVTKYPVEP
ncbi:MAG: alpha/beta fold hydrolase [Cyanophyceae cyanobacterium]